MPSGFKYQRHQSAVQFLKETKIVEWAGPYKEFSNKFGKNSKYKNSDLITIVDKEIVSFEIKCHKEGSDWGAISWDQAERLLNDEHIIIIDDSGNKVHFGAMGMEDYTYHHDERRRDNYLKRSAGIRGYWKVNPFSKNNLSRNLLWDA